MIQTTEPPTGRMAGVINMPAAAPARREGPTAVERGSAARELDAEVTRLLRVRGGELAEPLLWRRPSHRREVEAIVNDLGPIRSRLALLSSWEREAHLGSPVRLAYALVWLRLSRRRAGDCGPRLRVVARGLRSAPTGRG
jgi:hypothetical protein